MPIRPMRSSMLAALAYFAFLAACSDARVASGDEDDAVPEAERYGGTAVIGGAGDLQGLNGLVTSDYTANNIQRHMLFMTTVAYDEHVNLVHYLAERWDTTRVTGDSLELTFHVRRDVRWHDGTPTTAADVLFTFERAIDPLTAFPNISNFDPYARRAELVDEHTFRVRLRPHADFLDIWAQTAIMPRHLLVEVPPEQLLQHPFRYDPVGNGPFRFVRRVPGQEWVFEANPDFPQALGGRPYLDRIVYRAIPEQTTLLTELLTGGIDVFLQPSPSFAGQIEASPDTRLVTTPFRQYDYIAWNTRRPQFRDPRVRRALTMALDRAQLVAALRHGYGEVGRGTVTPAHWAFDPEDPETLLPHDPEGARRLLAEAGWEPGPDGVLRDREGNPFRFTLVTNAGNDVRRDAAEIAQAQLRPLGIVVQPRQLEFTTMLSMLQGRLDGSGRRVRDFDAVIGGWVVFFRQDDADILHCRAVDGPFQYVGYCNPRVDALIDTLAVVMDREEARPLWREYQRLIVRESPYTVLFYHTQITGVRTRLRDVTIDIRGETARARDWWVAPARR